MNDFRARLDALRAKRSQHSLSASVPRDDDTGALDLTFAGARAPQVKPIECLRVLKPGGHLLAFAGSRTVDLITLSLRLAGFDIRDSIAWLYASGFPKSLDISKAIDKAAGAKREVIGTSKGGGIGGSGSTYAQDSWTESRHGSLQELEITVPATPEAQRFAGWGTALKPGHEPIIMARKPFTGTVASNVVAHSTGGLNIDGTRIPTADKLGGGSSTRGQQMSDGWHHPWMDDPEAVAANAERNTASVARSEALGRWPANVVLDESQAAALDEQTGILTSGKAAAGGHTRHAVSETGIYGGGKGLWQSSGSAGELYGDSGGASRFFYVAKAPKSERPEVDGVKHPTVKPLSLMRWLVKLVTPEGGLILDPFAGSGTTLEAAVVEGFDSHGIEDDEDYIKLIVARLKKHYPTQEHAA